MPRLQKPHQSLSLPGGVTMGFTFDAKPAKKRKKHGNATVSKTERWLAPDRVDRVSVKAFGHNIKVWESAPRCPKCDRKFVDDKCPKATGKRKWCR